MALPAIIGLGSLWTALGSAFSTLMTLYYANLAKKVILIGVVIVATDFAVGQLLQLLYTYAMPLLQSLPSELSTFASFLPSNTQACLSAIIAVEIGCLTYSLTIKSLELQTKII